MGLKSIESTELESEWRAAANTYLGLTVSGYPNMFHMVSLLLPAFESIARVHLWEQADIALPFSFSCSSAVA